MPKQKNIDIWNGYLRLIREREAIFINAYMGGNKPDIIYQVFGQGKIQVCYVTGIKYSEFKTELYYTTKNPTVADIKKIEAYYASDPAMTADNISFEYYYLWGDNMDKKASSTHFLYADNSYSFLTTSKEEADLLSASRSKEFKEEQDWKELHKKDKYFNYNQAGYKFLGWQNSWVHTYFDEHRNPTNDPEKRRTFGYTKEMYPEYGSCIEQNHRRIDVSHDGRGSEHTVSCPACMIYWKYDSSD